MQMQTNFPIAKRFQGVFAPFPDVAAAVLDLPNAATAVVVDVNTVETFADGAEEAASLSAAGTEPDASAAAIEVLVVPTPLL